MAQDRDKITVVDIVCTWYTGSTWLNLLLGANSRAFTVGEPQEIRGLGRPICTLHGESCPFWSRFDADSEEDPYRQIARLADRRFLVLKNSKRFHVSEPSEDLAFRMIHLVRDGRPTVASYLRKHPDISMWQAAWRWTRRMKRDRRYLARQEQGPVMRVQYEQLQHDTVGTLKRLCAFIGMDYEESMLRYWEQEHHFLGGNRGALTHLAQRRNEDAERASVSMTGAADKVWDLEYYQNARIDRFVDERWKRELSDGQLRVFGLLAGRANRRLGYPRRTPCDR